MDTTDFAVYDKPLVINSCGLNTTLGDEPYQNRSLIVRRPNGRKDYQLMYVCSGQAKHMIKNKWHTLESGSVIIYKPGEPQFYSYQAAMPVLCQWVHFTGQYAAYLLERSELDKKSIFKIGENPEISQLFKRMIRDQQLSSPCHEVIGVGYLTQIIGLIGRAKLELADLPKYHVRNNLMKAVEHLYRHYSEPQSVNRCAEICNMNPYHFIHAFKECVGQSPYAFLIDLRMKHAKDLLKESDLQVKEIAASCGYENPLYFSRAFSKRYQMAPVEYRKRFSQT